MTEKIRPWPTELKLSKAKDKLSVTFADGFTCELPAEYLRVHSPSAEVQGHSPSERKLVSGKSTILIMKVEPVGNYAVQLVFSDGHSTGIFSWDYLYECGQSQSERWVAYLDELKQAGLAR